MMVPPGCRAPDFSASSTMASAMRSLMEPPGLPRSDLIHTLAPAPNRRLMRTWGVLPIVCRMLSALIGPPRVGVVVGQSGVARRRCAKTRHSLCTQLFYAWAISIWPGRLTSPHESTVPGNLCLAGRVAQFPPDGRAAVHHAGRRLQPHRHAGAGVRRADRKSVV